MVEENMGNTTRPKLIKMRLINRISLTGVFVMVLTAPGMDSIRAQSTPTPTSTQSTENKPVDGDNIVERKIHSTILNEERRAIIHLRSLNESCVQLCYHRPQDRKSTRLN